VLVFYLDYMDEFYLKRLEAMRSSENMDAGGGGVWV
jgi:hypothetical protein